MANIEALRHIAKVSMNDEIAAFLATCDAGQLTVTNSLGETYLLVQEDGGEITLDFPTGDYSGDPAAVKAFNAVQGR